MSAADIVTTLAIALTWAQWSLGLPWNPELAPRLSIGRSRAWEVARPARGGSVALDADPPYHFAAGIRGDDRAGRCHDPRRGNCRSAT